VINESYMKRGREIRKNSKIQIIPSDGPDWTSSNSLNWSTSLTSVANENESSKNYNIDNVFEIYV